MAEELVPEIKILLDGSEIPKTTLRKLVNARVSLLLDGSDMCKVTFEDDDMGLQDSASFAIGKEISISMGYAQKFEKLIEAEIVRVEHQYSTAGASTISLTGFDKMFRLNRTKESRSFLKMKDSDIASKIASELGLSADVDATSTVHEYLFQNNQSNLDFLKLRAKRINYEVRVEESKLLFKKLKTQSSEEVELKWDRDLVEFNPKIDATKIVEEVTVTGWNPKTKELIKGVAKAGSEVKIVSGSEGSKKISGKYGKASKNYKVDSPLTTQAEADAMAKARLTWLSMEYIFGDGICVGEPKIKVGKVIKISGIGKKVSGNYYVHSCEHIFNNSGYKTHFEVKRNIEK